MDSRIAPIYTMTYYVENMNWEMMIFSVTNGGLIDYLYDVIFCLISCTNINPDGWPI